MIALAIMLACLETRQTTDLPIPSDDACFWNRNSASNSYQSNHPSMSLGRAGGRTLFSLKKFHVGEVSHPLRNGCGCFPPQLTFGGELFGRTRSSHDTLLMSFESLLTWHWRCMSTSLVLGASPWVQAPTTLAWQSLHLKVKLCFGQIDQDGLQNEGVCPPNTTRWKDWSLEGQC